MLALKQSNGAKKIRARNDVFVPIDLGEDVAQLNQQEATKDNPRLAMLMRIEHQRLIWLLTSCWASVDTEVDAVGEQPD